MLESTNVLNVPIVTGNVILTSTFRPASRPSHHGIDFAPRPRGNPSILCYDNGYVILRQINNPSAGNWLEVLHDNGSVSTYMHLDSGFKMPELNSRVKRGERIGTMGATGKSTGVHLHFELRGALPRNGGWNAFDPLPLLMANSNVEIANSNVKAAPGGGNWPISEETIQALVRLGVMNSPDYWRGVKNVQHLGQLLKNVVERLAKP